MSWWDRWRGHPPAAPAPHAATSLGDSVRLGQALAGDRLTLDYGLPFGPFSGFVLPPPDAESIWRWERLDGHTLSRYPLSKLLLLLADLSPDISKALWDWQRFGNPGFEVHAYRRGTDTIDPRAETALQAFLQRLQAQYGALDGILSGLYAGPFFRGAFFAELVLDPTGRRPIDLVTPDPAIVRFRRVTDPERGSIWQLGQFGLGGFQALDRPTIRYLPLDPIFSPYGRPLVAPAVFSCLFLLSLMHDLKRVVQQQGYPRIDIAIDIAKLKELLPSINQMTLADFTTATTALLNQVKTAYANLQPDQAYIHDTSIAVNKPVGTVDASSLGAVDDLIRALERFLARGLKSAPFLMGLSETTTETQSNRQMDAFLAGISAVQHHAESLLGYLLTLGLQVQGLQAEVRWRFAVNRASERIRDAQADEIEIRNARDRYLLGWINQDQAAHAGAGVAKADQSQPRALPGNWGAASGIPAPLSGEFAKAPAVEVLALAHTNGAHE